MGPVDDRKATLGIGGRTRRHGTSFPNSVPSVWAAGTALTGRAPGPFRGIVHFSSFAYHQTPGALNSLTGVYSTVLPQFAGISRRYGVHLRLTDLHRSPGYRLCLFIYSGV